MEPAPTAENGLSKSRLRQYTAARCEDSLLTALAGLSDMRFHDLRHTNATLVLEAGVPAKVVSERLGHSGIGITLDTYSYVLLTMQEQAASKLEEMLFGSGGSGAK
ncbi:MAG: tyrosine-type recombinase/integrase [Bacillota bacterium]